MPRIFKLAAIDLDGTLLGHDTRISATNGQAVARLQNAGLQVVLASGRHYKNMRRYAEQLPGVNWIVSCQGGEISNLDRNDILTTEFLPAIRVQEALTQGAALGFTITAYGMDEVLTNSPWNEHLQFYSDLAGCIPRFCSNQEILEQPIFKLLWMGFPADIERTLQQNLVDLRVVQMVRTHAKLLEFMPLRVSKASGLQILSEHLGLTPAETITFGDGDNDVPMFEWSGISVAMAHGWPAALRQATYISSAGPVDTALSRAVDLVFEKHLVISVGVPSRITSHRP